ncbi:hypothetical protein EUTSA_v10017801mg [Eutrema salsugineum]|uniref:TOD1/MUCI70 glycosyltransferase-like domain-containing protein n=1 Tax=Eutrema salsugineum TaxID=72664 RepID=V4LN61_EUTSA|nr:uncharacterized protein LOC18026533 [Eutrema salsugineum]ESQ51975.1 hypothetical protein EUTSA_v10017801mg [Eutrema salsugineum]
MGFNGVVLPIQTITATRTKLSKMHKEKEHIVHWIFKFSRRRKKILFLISTLVFIRLLYVWRGEDGQDIEVPPSQHFSVITNKEQISDIQNNLSYVRKAVKAYRPRPPPYFHGYKLPQEHPCNRFTLPPPPADKKRTGPRPCPVCYLPLEEAIALIPSSPSFSPVLKNLTYIHEEPLNRKTEFGGSDFGGYPTLKQRRRSFNIKGSMSVHCGFVKGPEPGRGTGFDIDETDLLEMKRCRGIVVASTVFDAFDDVKSPSNISKYSEQTVCFFMFVDEKTESSLKRDKSFNSTTSKVGLWRVVVVHNLPYTDGRRNGKVPKLLVHRLFPNSRYSIWVDGKLDLVVDPHQILERFLWRENVTFAISRHYKRFDVFVEAEANKAAGKYANASIDFQVNFYKNEGLTPYSPAKLPITSDVPEGCVILREHVPISNLFTCLWFNEVDRFTSRDQISFSTVRDKIAAKIKWNVSMFLDCERRNFVVQRYHRADQEKLKKKQSPMAILPPPALISSYLPRKLSNMSHVVSRTPPSRRGRDKQSTLPTRLPQTA